MENRKKDLLKRLDEMKERVDQAHQKIECMEKIVRVVEIVCGIYNRKPWEGKSLDKPLLKVISTLEL